MYVHIFNEELFSITFHTGTRRAQAKHQPFSSAADTILRAVNLDDSWLCTAEARLRAFSEC